MNVSALILWREHRGDVITLVIQQGEGLSLILKTPLESRT